MKIKHVFEKLILVANRNLWLKNDNLSQHNKRKYCIGKPRYLLPFYLRFGVFAIENHPFSETNPLIYRQHWFLMQIYNIRSISLAYNEVRLYSIVMC
jgi:hypothetical protein